MRYIEGSKGPDVTTKAFAYLRTSSAANVGGDKDSDKRQLAAIKAYAEANNIGIVGTFYDAAVSGADPILDRPGFMDMLTEISGDGVRTILVETANRFARDLMVQELGFRYLKDQEITLIAVDKPDSFLDHSPMAVAFRQMMGVFSQLEKAMTVAKLRGARERKRRQTGRCEGRKPVPEAARKLARRLHGKSLSLREIAGRLADKGFLGPSGKPYLAGSIKAMLD
jgi:DNA invertase Pin-like site-specific DNA recombinase